MDGLVNVGFVRRCVFGVVPFPSYSLLAENTSSWSARKLTQIAVAYFKRAAYVIIIGFRFSIELPAFT